MDDILKQLLNDQFVKQFFGFLALFFAGSFLFLWKKAIQVRSLSLQVKRLKRINSELGKTEVKQELISKFIDETKDRYIIKSIINEWLLLQRSLSNFQKYDFDLHINSFLRGYKFNQGNYIRILLLIGLLFTFVFLSYSFIELGIVSGNPSAGTTEVLGFINRDLIPNIGFALTSTIAAIFVSFVISMFGSFLESKVNSLHKELSNFLIIHVHPTFETANDDTYLNKIKAVMDGLTQNIRESNQRLDAISRQSIDTLERLGEGIGRFTQSTEQFKTILNEFSKVQKQTYENSSEIKLSVDGLSDSVKGINTIFEAEGNIIKEVNKSLEIHRHELEGLVNVLSSNERTNEKIENVLIELNREFNSNLHNFQDTFSGKIEGLSFNIKDGLENFKDEVNNDVMKGLRDKLQQINSSFETTVKQITETTKILDKAVSEDRNVTVDQAGEFKNSLLEITNTFSNEVEDVNTKLLKMQEIHKKQNAKIIRLQEELLRKVQKQHNVNVEKKGVFNSIKNIFK
jgi:methyl-accepting chemotaxis protein